MKTYYVFNAGGILVYTLAVMLFAAIFNIDYASFQLDLFPFLGEILDWVLPPIVFMFVVLRPQVRKENKDE